MFSTCITSSATTASFPFMGFLRNLKTGFVPCISHHGYRVCLQTVFCMADMGEMAVRGSWENNLHAQTAKISQLKDTKCFPLVFSLLTEIYKMALKIKIILPTHNDIMSYQHIHCPIPANGRCTATHTTHANRGHGQVGSRKADRNRAVLRL